MFKSKFYFIIVFLLSFASFNNVNAQLSRKHYLPPITSDDAIRNQYIYISTPKTGNVSFKITPIGKPTSEIINGTVSNSTPFSTTSANVGNQLFQSSNLTATVINDKGYIIEADDVVYVSVRIRSSSPFHAAAIVSKGLSAPGTEFRVGGFQSSTPRNGHLNFVSVLATQDNTQVTFDEFTAGITINNYPTSNPIPIVQNLNEGESFIVSVSTGAGNPNDLLGTLVKSDKPVVVNIGSATGSFYEGSGNRDYGMDQLVDASKVGKEYIFVRGDGLDDWENILVVAHFNNTTLKINGVDNPVVLNKGEWFTIEGNNFTANNNLYLETSEPVFAFQGVGFGTEAANQGLFFVPPLNCESTGFVDNIPEIQEVGLENFTEGGVTVVTKKGATLIIEEDSIDPTHNIDGPKDVTGNNDYVTYKVTNLSGNVTVKSLVKNALGNDVPTELYCSYFNRNGAATSGGFYSGFPSAPEIKFETPVGAIGECIPDVTLTAANTGAFDSFEWQIYNETTKAFDFVSNQPTYKPSQPGRYKLIGTINCTLKTFESDEIPVSLCPDDLDNDKIIDNIDDDTDGDGILNEVESLGDGTIDISDINNPKATTTSGQLNIFNSNTYNQTEAASSFTGDASGNFISTLAPGVGTTVEYGLQFNKNVNIEFSTNGSNTTTDEDFYIVRIGPNDQNITIVNPNDEILIDRSFNDKFIAGITEFSASEIKFKFKPGFSGNSTFKLVASRVNQITFIHKSNGTLTSTFNGNLIVKYAALDSDGDGVENMFDLDSNNDGVPDINKTSADSDGDGVLNYLDIDTDNDGIYDIVEAGYGNLDTNNDGYIDSASAANVGTNGLLDTLESTPDSGTLSTPLQDSDSDSNFNFLELDSDNDDCFDVVEAGFTGDGSGKLFSNPTDVDANGKVINNTNGYTVPNSDYNTSAPIIITTFVDDIICENDTDTIEIVANATSYQWQLSTDNGTTFNNIVENTTINGGTFTQVNQSKLLITNTPQSFNNYQFKVILERTGNSCAKPSNEIKLTVNPLPIIKNNPAQIQQCVNTANGQTTINLTTAQSNISVTTGAIFDFYEDQAGTNLITNKTSYPVTVNVVKSVWVKTTSKDGCTGPLTELELQIAQTPDNPYNDTQPAQCDDFLDANGNDTPGSNDDTDQITTFNLDETQIVNSINPPANTKVFFYENSTDRANSLDNIDIKNYRNDLTKIDITNTSEGIRFPIYYKIVSTLNNSCEGIGEFYLEIHSVPEANTTQDFELCDDALSGSTTDGRNANINLRDRVPEILGPTQTLTDYNVTFHTTATGARTNTDIITNDTSFTNSAPAGFMQGDISEQTIFVRVQDKNGDPKCYNDHISFKVVVNPIPIVSNTISSFPVCDIPTSTDSDPRNRIAQNIDLTSKNSEILAGKTNHRVAFYLTQQDADNGNEIGNPSDFQNVSRETTFPSNFKTDDPGIQTIFFKIIDLGGNMCASVFSTFQLLIYPEPDIPLNISDYSDCDNTTDSSADDTNGINGDISLKNKIPDILTNYNPSEFADFSVTFYTSLVDAQSGNKTLAIDENKYENTINNERIFVRVENIKNTPVICVNTRLSFNINIKPLPNFMVMGEENIDTPQIICLNDLPLTIEAENPAANYNYEWRNVSGTLLSTSEKLDVTTGGKYTVTATDQSHTSIACSRSRTIVVKESNIATLQASFIKIIDESNNISSENKISVSIDTVTNNLGEGDYQFALRNDDNGQRLPIIGFQDSPLFENLEGGIYTVIVNDKNGCSPDAELQISVVQFPKFFTPNGDGQNDTWVVKGANKAFYPNSSINIFNRYGKLIAQVPIDGQGWNGTYQGKTLPPDDYWYSIQLIPADTSKPTIVKKGNFSLVRR